MIGSASTWRSNGAANGTDCDGTIVGYGVAKDTTEDLAGHGFQVEVGLGLQRALLDGGHGRSSWCSWTPGSDVGLTHAGAEIPSAGLSWLVEAMSSFSLVA